MPERWRASKRRAKATYELLTEISAEARRNVDERRRRGDKRSSIIDKLLNKEILADVVMSDVQLNNFVGSIQAATADTTGSAIITHILYLASHPSFQDKARKELDAVCGLDRIPKWSDFDSCPYINCIMKEGNRIHTKFVNAISAQKQKADLMAVVFPLAFHTA